MDERQKVSASRKAVIPVNIAGKDCKIEAEIVKENISLLLSKSSLKKAGAIIDMSNNKAVIFGKEIDLCLSTSGNYCIDICPSNLSNITARESLNEEVYLLQALNPPQNKEQIIKIHKQFGHATSANMKSLFSKAGIVDTEVNKIIDTIVNDCESCTLYKKQQARPVVALSKADDFNQTVLMDLHQLETNLWYMHIIDEFTRYSNAQIIHNKTATVHTFMKGWISLFG